jgi:hypothetical protein
VSKESFIREAGVVGGGGGRRRRGYQGSVSSGEWGIQAATL